MNGSNFDPRSQSQHYLPRSYLMGFSSDGKGVWIYDREQRKFRQQSIKSTATKKGNYVFTNEEGTPNNSIEQMLSEIEGEMKLIIGKLEKREPVGSSERDIIAWFVAFQMTRVPYFWEWLEESDQKMMQRFIKMYHSSPEVCQAIVNSFEKDKGMRLGMTGQDVYDFFNKGEYKLVWPREKYVRDMLFMADEFSKIFFNLNWIVLLAPSGSSFVTSDNPFLLLPPFGYDPTSFWGVGIATRGAIKFIPLSGQAALAMLEPGQALTYALIDRRQIREMNANTGINSHRFIIAKDFAQLVRVVKMAKVERGVRKPRVSIS